MNWDWRRTLQRLDVTDWVVIAALVIGTFLRLYNFTNTLQFLGDQGRDATVVSRIFRDKDIVLIGPVTSTGNMYLGPLYYYFMVPFLIMSFPSPVGPAYAVAALSVLTAGLLYVLGQELIGRRGAAIASVMFSFSSIAVYFARFSWNPNPAPLFGLLFIWCLYRTEKKQYKFWVGVSACVAVLMQLHYVALLSLFVAGVVWLKQLFFLRHETRKDQLRFFKAFGVAVVIFLAALSPLIVFDVRHEYLNAQSLVKFLVTSQSTASYITPLEKLYRVVSETHGRSLQIFFEITIGKQRSLNSFLLVLVVLVLGYLCVRKLPSSEKLENQTGIRLLALTYVLSVIGLAFYRSSVFDHYIAFLFPITFLIFGALFSWMSKWKAGVALASVCLIGYCAYNFYHMPLKTLGWTVNDMERTSQSVADRVKPGEKYNIVLLSETKDVYGENYRYFLSTTPTPPLRIEHFGEVETLFIIDEQKLVKDVTSLPIYEIVVFSNKKPSEVYQVPGGPRVTVLRKQANDVQ